LIKMSTQDGLLKGAIAVALIALIVSLAGVGYLASKIGALEGKIQDLSTQVSTLQGRLQELEGKVSQLSTQQPQPQQPQQPKPPQEQVTITVVGPWSGKEAEYFGEVIKAFEEEYPNIKVKYVTKRAEDLAQILPVQFESGMTPGDVIITPWAWFIVKMAQKGHVVDVSQYVKKDQYVGGIVDNVVWNGNVWGAPFTMWLKPGFWYRKSFFEKYGLKEPETWDEFLELLEKLKKIPGVKNPIASGDSVGWPLSDITEHFLITFGGPDLQYDLISCKRKFTDPEVADIFKTKLVPLLEKGYFSEPMEWTSAVERWWAGEYGLYFMGTWIAGMVKDPDDIDFFPLPGCKAVVGGADYAFVPKYTKHKEAALTFLHYIATKGQGVHVGTRAGKIPTWLGISTDQLWTPMQSVYKKVRERNMKIVPDLDDSVGGDWQTLFWDQLKLLWVQPGQVDNVLQTLAREHPQCGG